MKAMTYLTAALVALSTTSSAVEIKGNEDPQRQLEVAISNFDKDAGDTYDTVMANLLDQITRTSDFLQGLDVTSLSGGQ